MKQIQMIISRSQTYKADKLHFYKLGISEKQ